MGNKNSLRKRRGIAREAKLSHPKSSRNERRNSQQVILNGVTKHVPIDPSKPIVPKGHQHMDKTYRGRVDVHGNSLPVHQQPDEGFEFDNTPIKI